MGFSQTHHKLKCCQYSNAYNILFCWQIVLKFCTVQGNAKIENKWAAETDAWDSGFVMVDTYEVQ